MFILINTNNHEPQVLPLGLLSIATAVKSYGHEVVLMDGMVDSRSIKKVIADFQAQVVGLSVISPSVLKDVKMIPSFSRERGIFVVCGGTFATLGAEAFLNDRVADPVSIGEGEGT